MKKSEENKWVDSITAQWINLGIKIQNGTSISKIQEAENILEFKFPEDFTLFYSRVNGFEDFEWDENMFSIWSIERIIPEYSINSDKNFISFCDYLISSHNIGFLKKEKGIFKEYDLAKPITLTFKESIELITRGSDLIY